MKKKEQLQKPRFEFRVFGENFPKALGILSNILPVYENIKSSETYIIAKNNHSLNMKIRDNTLEVKTLLERNGSFQKWTPMMKIDFPLKKELVCQNIFPLLQLDRVSLSNKESYDIKEFLGTLNNEETIKIAEVKKDRTQYAFDSILCEATRININNTPALSLCIESEDIEELRSFICFLKLDQFKNTSYIEMLDNTL